MEQRRPGLYHRYSLGVQGVTQIWEGGDLELEDEGTTPTYSKAEEEGSSNYTSKSTQLMQGGDRAWGGREKRFKSMFLSLVSFLTFFFTYLTMSCSKGSLVRGGWSSTDKSPSAHGARSL